jgi:hypothetical protein
MTIPFTIPFGRRRFLLSIEWLPAGPDDSARTAVDDPAAYGATDAELARLNSRAAVAEERLHAEALASLYGLRR